MDISFNQTNQTSSNERHPVRTHQSIERRLEVSEARIHRLLAILPQIVWLAEVDGSVTNFNPRWYEYTGLTPGESLGWEFLKVLYPEDRNTLRDSFAASVAKSDTVASDKPQSDKVECRIRGADGIYRWFIWQRTPVRGAGGEILEWIGSYTPKEPIAQYSPECSTEGRRAQGAGRKENPLLVSAPVPTPYSLLPTFSSNQQPAKLRIREQAAGNTVKSTHQRRRNLMDKLSQAIVWEADATTEQFTFVSQSAEQLLGYPVERWLKEPNFWVNLIHPEDRQWTVAVCRKKMFQCRDYELEYRCLAADKRVVWLRDRACIVRDDQGRAHKRRGLMVDITIAKQAEAAVQSRTRFWDAIAQLSQQALSGTTVSALTDKAVSLVCQTLAVEYCQVLELLPDGNFLKLRTGVGWRSELLGQALIDASANTQAGYTLQSCQPVIVEDLRCETRFRGSPLLHDHHIVSGMSVIIAGASSARQGGGFESRGRRGAGGVGREESRGRRGAGEVGGEVFTHILQENAFPATPAPPHQGSPASPASLASPAPSPRPFGVLAAHTSRQRVFSRTDVNFLATVANVLAVAIQSQRADQALYEVKAQLALTTSALEKRTSELDQFAYVASHDLKAPLRAIANLSQWIEEDISDQLNEENLHQMQLMRARVHRLEALIEGLLQYSRAARLKSEPEPVNVEALLTQVIDTLYPPTQFTIEIAPGMPTFVTERLPLQQVFTHLIDNAIEHHPSAQGTVKIGVREQLDAYEFSVADDGAGIAPQFHERVFGIFQTLQARDTVENTGVGLAIVKRIVEGKGGTIRLESQEGQGATFYFTWPKQLSSS
jgi:PAS domain S-box-containing protein